MKNLNFHKKFSLNGNEFTSSGELLAYSKTISTSIFSFLSEWFDANDFVIVQTSGSTGKPKQIKLKKEYMMNSAIATGAFFNLQEKTTALLCLSTNYIAGKMMLVRALVLGWHIDIVEPSAHPLNGIQKKYDFSAMVPLQLYNSIDRLDSIEKLIVGGGVVSNDLQQKISKLKTEIFATYGMTETITHIAVKKLNNNVIAIPSNREKQSAKKEEITSVVSQLRNDGNRESCFSLLPNIKIAKDTRGCLVIDAPNISNNQIITNDLVALISETEFKWLGRYDTIINSGGVKLIPEQIEHKLSAVIDRRFFVAGIADSVLGEKLILIIEKEVTSSNYDANRPRRVGSIEKPSNLKSQISNLSTLSKFEIPREIYFIEQFIETETKKINRAKTLAKLSVS